LRPITVPAHGARFKRLHRPAQRRLAPPSYDPASLRPGIVHLGVGNFHRAHQAAYLHDLAEQGISSDWGVVGVGLVSARLRGLSTQDCLYSLIERSADGDRARTIGSLLRYLSGQNDPEAVLNALAAPTTKVVSLTVTGDGYKVDRDTGELDLADTEVVAELGDANGPRTVPGFLVEALRRRRDRGLEPFTVLSCDNLPRNGATVRHCLRSYADLIDPALATWIDANTAFPSTVVDRITPQTTSDVRRQLASDLGLEDRFPVVTEPFSQWVVEDAFGDERPPLEEVGVRFVSDVAPYELFKKRLLNGAHCAISYLGLLAGYERIDEALKDPVVLGFARALMLEEIAPLVSEPAGVTASDYVDTLLQRFANPMIADRLGRLAARGSTKMPSYLLPSLKDALAAKRPHGLLTLAVAGWVRYLQGVDVDGRTLEVEDRMADELRPLACAATHDARPLLAERSVFGDLGESAEFARELRDCVAEIEQSGARDAMKTELAARSLAAA
jgi:mannitol-1-phosphate/altronate dehydrogenase